MKTINILSILMLLVSSCGAQIKNAKTETVKISGNCGMCESTIEKAGNKKKVATVDWDKETKQATITYDAKKTNKNEILQRIALAGYDNELFLAPDETYNNLHGCCQYERASVKTAVVEKKENIKELHDHSTHDHSTHDHGKEIEKDSHHDNDNMSRQTASETMSTQGIAQLYDNYFLLKDAFVKSNSKAILNYSGALYRTIKAIDMNSLDHAVHMVWMKKMKELNQDASNIANTRDIEKQRSYFIRLSANVYALMKVEKPKKAVYYDHCPMANGGKGANWLSLEKEVKNPYYGSAMLSCGKIVETIK